MYEEQAAIFTEALHKDLRKPKWEAVVAEIDNNKNDIIGILRFDHEIFILRGDAYDL